MVIKRHFIYVLLLIVFLQNCTPPSEIPNKSNDQPHIVAIERDEYFQYMIAV